MLTLTKDERIALTFIAHNDPRDGFVRRTWLEFKTAICGLLQRTRANGWIPVSERLPESQVAVLGHCCGEIGVCKRFSCGWYWDEEYSHQAISPSHWMPLPEPPEVK